MKAPRFDYVRPAAVADAVAALADAGDEGKVLAGGQSLVPVLAMRLGRPAVLVDINAVSGLDQLSVADDTLYLGAASPTRTRPPNSPPSPPASTPPSTSRVPPVAAP